jgi:hypothetical protein
MNCLMSETSLGILAVEERGLRWERRVGGGVDVAVANRGLGFRWVHFVDDRSEPLAPGRSVVALRNT